MGLEFRKYQVYFKDNIDSNKNKTKTTQGRKNLPKSWVFLINSIIEFSIFMMMVIIFPFSAKEFYFLSQGSFNVKRSTRFHWLFWCFRTECLLYDICSSIKTLGITKKILFVYFEFSSFFSFLSWQVDTERYRLGKSQYPAWYWSSIKYLRGFFRTVLLLLFYKKSPIITSGSSWVRF